LVINISLVDQFECGIICQKNDPEPLRKF